MLTSIKLPKEKISFYKEYGYVKIENAIPDELLENIQKGYRNAINGHYLDGNWGDVWKKDSLLQLQNPHKNVPELYDSEYRDIIVGFAQQLENDDIEFWYDQLIYKPVGNKWETPWHQDAGYWQGDIQKIPTAITGWLAVEDVDESMGCMSFIPGSHKNGKCSHQDVSKTNPIGGALQADVDLSCAVNVPLKAGDITLHNQYTLHYTSGNSGTADRCGLVNHLRSFKDMEF
jgi:phytanoyl-CoA hydroxylase